MPRNPILDEIYQVREQLVAEFDGDLHAYVEDARRRALALGRLIAVPQASSKQDVESEMESPAVRELETH